VVKLRPCLNASFCLALDTQWIVPLVLASDALESATADTGDWGTVLSGKTRRERRYSWLEAGEFAALGLCGHVFALPSDTLLQASGLNTNNYIKSIWFCNHQS
jgi:hypothetical protein